MSWEVFDEFKDKGTRDFMRTMGVWFDADRLDGYEWARRLGLMEAARTLDVAEKGGDDAYMNRFRKMDQMRSCEARQQASYSELVMQS